MFEALKKLARKILRLVLHPLYENKYTRSGITQLVNLFKPDFVMVGRHKIFIDKSDRVVSLELLLSKQWEEYERKLFGDSMKVGDTVVDIGAHIGTYTLIAAERVGPKGKVYAFEPLTKNFELLKKNIEANGYKNVILINKAVSNKNGQSKLFLSKEDNYGDQRIFDSRDNRESLAIQTTTLDSFFVKGNQKLNVIKMDIQGSEVLALKGGSKTLSSNKHLKLFTEFWPKALKDSGSSATEYLALLKKYKLSLSNIDSQAETVKPISSKKLLESYPENSMVNADLYCTK